MSSNKAFLALTVFELPEYLGQGEGFSPQFAITGFPPGYCLTISLKIPKNERWYWILCLNGSCPSDALILRYRWVTPRGAKRVALIFLHEGWVGNLICPFGMKAMKEGSTVEISVANVTALTGEPDLDVFVPFAQTRHGGAITVDYSYTGFFFSVYREYFEVVDKMVKEVLGGAWLL